MWSYCRLEFIGYRRSVETSSVILCMDYYSDILSVLMSGLAASIHLRGSLLWWIVRHTWLPDAWCVVKYLSDVLWMLFTLYGVLMKNRFCVWKYHGLFQEPLDQTGVCFCFDAFLAMIQIRACKFHKSANLKKKMKKLTCAKPYGRQEGCT